jgi:hypothetical protein
MEAMLYADCGILGLHMWFLSYLGLCILQVYVNETSYLYNMLGILGLFTTTMLQSLRKPNDEDRYVQMTSFRWTILHR